MAEKAVKATTPTRRKRPDWRSREVRAKEKMVARRVSEADHAALRRYAEAHGTKIAEMIAPAIDAIIEQAHAFCQEAASGDSAPRAKAS